MRQRVCCVIVCVMNFPVVLQSMLKEEEFFRQGSPDASATDDDM